MNEYINNNNDNDIFNDNNDNEYKNDDSNNNNDINSCKSKSYIDNNYININNNSNNICSGNNNNNNKNKKKKKNNNNNNTNNNNGTNNNSNTSENNVETQKSHKSRNRRVLWYNPLYCSSIKINLGKQFLRLVDKHFPDNHCYRKIFNRKTLKISCSCMNNVKSITQ